MKVNLNKLSLGLAASMMLFAALPAQAANKYGCIYVVDPYDKIVKDPYGNCIRTPFWTAEKNIPECGGVAAVEPPPAAPVVESLTLGTDALFDFDRYNIKPSASERLNRLAADLRRVSSVSSILLVGHTDSKGSESYNYRLGQRRADAVAGYLAGKGVSTSLMTTQSRGELDPVAPNTTPDGRDNPEGRALNRRVVITVTAQEKVISQ
jgi:OOP family OmpA-OmpF porin